MPTEPEEYIRESLAGVVKHRRQELGVSQRELAKLAGLSDGFVSKIERAELSPSLGSLHKLSLGLSLDLRRIIDQIAPRYGELRSKYTVSGGTLATMNRELAEQVVSDLGTRAAAAAALGVSPRVLSRLLAA